MKALPIDSLALFPDPVGIFQDKKGSALSYGKIEGRQMTAIVTQRMQELRRPPNQSLGGCIRVAQLCSTRGCVQVVKRNDVASCRMKSWHVPVVAKIAVDDASG
jgi:hypothetical protein